MPCCCLRGGCRTSEASARLVFGATHPTGNSPHFFGTLRNALRSLCCHRISTARAKAWESANSDNRTFESTRHPASQRKRGLMFRNGSGNYVPDDCDAKTLAEKSEAARLSFAGRLEPTKKAGLLLCVHGAGRRIFGALAVCVVIFKGLRRCF